MAIKILSAASFLTFTDRATSNIKWKHIHHRLRLSDKLKSGMSLQVASSHLWFQQVATLTKVLHISASNSLNMSSHAIPRALILTTESGLPIAHWAIYFISHPTFSVLNLTHTVTCELVKNNVANTLTLSHIVAYELVKATNITQLFSLHQAVSVYKVNKNFIGPYND